MANVVCSVIIICFLSGILQKYHLHSQIGAEARKLLEDIHIPPTTISSWSTATQRKLQTSVVGAGSVHGSQPSPPSSDSIPQTADRVVKGRL
ncbi:hypothetical protein M5689_023911 [Euphorbia peplus]|nr:hypothetical protein M5689_023911 [Euphorbia peplus]